MKIKTYKLLDIKSPVFPTRLSLLACILLAIGGISFGLLEKSLAVQTNGFIAAIEILNSLLFLAAVNQSVRLPDVTYNFGYGKYESLAMLFGTVLLSVILIITLITPLLFEYKPGVFIELGIGILFASNYLKLSKLTKDIGIR